MTKWKIVLIKFVINNDNNRKRQSIQLKLINSTSKKRKSFVDYNFFCWIYFFHSFRFESTIIYRFRRFQKMKLRCYDISRNKIFKKNFSRIDVQSILFFNKLLNETKKDYWFTKLKIIEIVWIMKEIRHMIKFIKLSSTIVYTNHFVAIFIFEQITLIITNIDKFNLRLIRVLQYFFNFNLTIRHKIEKFNIISSVLSRLLNMLQSNVKNKINVFNVLYNHYIDFTNNEIRFVIFQNMSITTYYIILIKMLND